MKVIQHIGLGLFLLALVLMGAVPFMAQYQVTDGVIEKVAPKFYDNHREELVAQLQSIKGQDFGKFEFLNKLDELIEAANVEIKANGSWEIATGFFKYEQKEYKLWTARYASTGFFMEHQMLFFFLVFVVGSFGALLWIIPQFWEGPPGIKNNNIYHNPATSRGWLGIVAGIYFICFYLLLYFMPYLFTETIALTDPVAHLFGPADASQWFIYGLMYTIAVLVMGLRMFAKYRHNNYHLIRTASVMFFQLGFAFMLPNILAFVNGVPSYDLKNIWPLDHSFFYDWRVNDYLGSKVGMVMFLFGIGLIVLGIPLLTYFYGKRWYCSWVCGCGGLAETLGDPYRQLSDKSLKAWRIERYLVHGVLVFAVVMTAIVLYHTITGTSQVLGLDAYNVRFWYGLLISSIFAGVVGTGFYPLMGNRVWCRFGCPLAAMFGIIQRFKSRFRITTNGDQCISCGNCSTYCEQGIDVRWYAQRGQNIVRASCVGCGVCAAVCPRGVLRLENGPDDNEVRLGVQAIHISRDEVKVLS